MLVWIWVVVCRGGWRCCFGCFCMWFSWWCWWSSIVLVGCFVCCWLVVVLCKLFGDGFVGVCLSKWWCRCGSCLGWLGGVGLLFVCWFCLGCGFIWLVWCVWCLGICVVGGSGLVVWVFWYWGNVWWLYWLVVCVWFVVCLIWLCCVSFGSFWRLVFRWEWWWWCGWSCVFLLCIVWCWWCCCWCLCWVWWFSCWFVVCCWRWVGC